VGKYILQHCECRLVPDVPDVWPDGKGRGGQDGADERDGQTGGKGPADGFGRLLDMKGGWPNGIGTLPDQGGGWHDEMECPMGWRGSAGRGFVGAGRDGRVSEREGRKGPQGRVSEQRRRVKLVAWIMCACSMLGPVVLHPIPHQWNHLC
jgi:hypothetical protein